MADTTYTDGITLLTADTMNDLNRLHYTILGDPANAAAVNTALGLGTGSSPQFAGVNIGHATDTTITRVSAGVIAVEGTNVLTTATGALKGANTDITSLAAPELGAATATTQSSSDNTTKVATTAMVQSAVALKLSGDVVQTITYEDPTGATGTTLLPFDDTAPQNTKGDQYMSQTITPTNASNTLKIDVVVHLAHSAGGHMSAAVFRDTDATCLGASSSYTAAGTMVNVKFTVRVSAGSTSLQTFKVRCGCNAVGTTTFNGTAGTRKFGGYMISSITITELKA